MKFNWRTSRITLFFLFVLTGFYALVFPKAVLKIVQYYGAAREQEKLNEAMKDLNK